MLSLDPKTLRKRMKETEESLASEWDLSKKEAQEVIERTVNFIDENKVELKVIDKGISGLIHYLREYDVSVKHAAFALFSTMHLMRDTIIEQEGKEVWNALASMATCVYAVQKERFACKLEVEHLINEGKIALHEGPGGWMSLVIDKTRVKTKKEREEILRLVAKAEGIPVEELMEGVEDSEYEIAMPKRGGDDPAYL